MERKIRIRSIGYNPMPKLSMVIEGDAYPTTPGGLLLPPHKFSIELGPGHGDDIFKRFLSLVKDISPEVQKYLGL
jgi:hypothetical protein